MVLRRSLPVLAALAALQLAGCDEDATEPIDVGYTGQPEIHFDKIGDVDLPLIGGGGGSGGEGGSGGSGEAAAAVAATWLLPLVITWTTLRQSQLVNRTGT